uniref:Photosystem I assembly protein Ycf4 n=1 Tax=Hyalogonium fusiforme TaxID=2926373 RepID=A0A9E7V7F0_9CHLO|nr:photosystem I assembly protein Ycf4 [Hyalogonium fusiforme]
MRIFRWGYPGKNRRIDLSYSLKDVEAIKVELKGASFQPQRTIFLKLKGKREIPLTGIGEPLTLKEIEKQASELANFLQVSLEGL